MIITIVVEVLVTFIIYGLLILYSYSIYQNSGWRKAEHYLIAVYLSQVAIAFIFAESSSAGDLELLFAGPSFAFGILFCFLGYQGYQYQRHKRQVEDWIDRQIDAMLPPPEEELIQIKHTMGYLKNSYSYNKVNGDLERAELTRRWRIKKRNEIFDPFLWKQFARKG